MRPLKKSIGAKEGAALKKNIGVLSLVLFLISYVNLLPVVAEGGTLFDGQTVQLAYYAPDTSSIFRGPWTAVVGAGAEFTFVLPCFSGASCIDVDISDTNILVTMNYGSEPGNFTNHPFNGIRIYDINGQIPDFTSVIINSATNLPGFDASRIAFDSNNIWINFQSLIGTGYPLVSLDVAGASGVPEPATMILLGPVLIGLAGLRRKFRK
jgi:hypothetical protein